MTRKKESIKSWMSEKSKVQKPDLTQATFLEFEPDQIVNLMRSLIAETTKHDGSECIGSFIFVHGRYRFEYNANTQLYVLESRQFDQGKIQEDDEEG